MLLTLFLLVPGPSPYGIPAATVANTKWPTTATWNTAQQPAANPTTYVPANPPPAATTTTAQVPNVPTTTAAPVPTPSAPAGGAALYGQCGGVSRSPLIFCRRELTMLYYLEWLEWSYDLLSRHMHQVER